MDNEHMENDDLPEDLIDGCTAYVNAHVTEIKTVIKTTNDPQLIIKEVNTKPILGEPLLEFRRLEEKYK